MTGYPYTDADVKLVEQAILHADPPLRPGYINGPDVLTAEARAVLDALAAAGRLLPEGTHTVEQYNTRLYRGDTRMDEPDHAQTRDHAQARVDWHARKREAEPGWPGVAVLVRRYQHTTPWMTVEEGS